ncbi:histidinol-phosphate transaminase [Mannheimia massilioguelmaensis]|uniref:histidinol-phosphate transaminase n=1 Tax=Mannheimia massilioguelmaensis TaxID=1604354 RepID=UPI0005CAB4D4|nr:histidinol-phosphate transaminase [Mannheimia massilioguelmaensis]
MSITTLSRKNIQALTPYQSARKLGGNGTIWLNANEYPTSPDFQLSGKDLNRYPEPQPQAVIENYARYAGVQPENVIVTRGGDEGIELAIKAFCQPEQDAILYCPPTYGMYAVSAETIGVERVTINQTAEFQLDLAKIKQALAEKPNIKVVFLCNPNNPTGTLLNRADVLELLEITRNRAILVLDEAYIEFTQAVTFVPEIANYPHLAIIRTLSKAFALAGLRCGFVLAPPELIEILNKVIAPYPIPVPSADIAKQALRPANIEIVKQRVQGILNGRDWLIKELAKLPNVVEIFDTHANYVLVKFQDGQKVFKALWDEGIILRDQHKAVNLADCVRITIGTDEENAKVIEAIKSL